MAEEMDPNVRDAITQITEVISRTPRETLEQHAQAWKDKDGAVRLSGELVKALRFQILSTYMAIRFAMRQKDYQAAVRIVDCFDGVLVEYRKLQSSEHLPVEIEGMKQVVCALKLDLQFLIENA